MKLTPAQAATFSRFRRVKDVLHRDSILMSDERTGRALERKGLVVIFYSHELRPRGFRMALTEVGQQVYDAWLEGQFKYEAELDAGRFMAANSKSD